MSIKKINIDYPLLTDLYQLTMSQGYWQSGMLNEKACFHAFYRENPFKGGYAIACGIENIVKLIENFHFTKDDIDYLSSLIAPGGGNLFSPDFLDYLSTYTVKVDIDSVLEGTVVFPNDPLVRVIGSIMDCQIIETALLNCINFETLIATKAARICTVADAPVAEFGLRRAQGENGGIAASRAAIIGGCSSTSNVLAGKLFNIPVSGTHAHSWVMAFDSELEAFRAYAKIFPNNCVLLVDTYDIEKGVQNAIIVGLEMKEHGQKLSAIRIDSGDLAWEAKRARKQLDDAGLYEVGIVLSNDLDEYTIKSIKDAGAPVTSWGVGTKLSTAYDQPALGGVYKLSAKKTQNGEWEDCVKVSGNASKLTVPGILDVRRYFHESGFLAGDMIFDIKHGVQSETIVDPADSLRQKNLAGKKWETLLHPLVRKGKVVYHSDSNSVINAQKRCREQLNLLDESQKRILNPHSYPVGLEFDLFMRRKELVSQLLHLSSTDSIS